MQLRRFRTETVAVQDMSEDHWRVILGTAERVLTRTDGLRASILARQDASLFYAPDDTFIGLITHDVRPETFRGRRVVGIYTGNAWVHPAWRGGNLPQWFGVRMFAKTRLRWPTRRLYWFFGSNSYLSYLGTSRNLRSFWPRHDRQTPDWERAYMFHLGQHIYGAGLDGENGIWRGDHSRAFTQQDTTVSAELARDPHLAFYLRRNPGYRAGDKLMCLAPLTADNVASIVWHVFQRLARRPHRPSNP